MVEHWSITSDPKILDFLNTYSVLTDDQIRRFVVTAAHCFCRGEYPIDCQTRMVDGKPTSHPVYPIFKHVIIYVGVNDFRLDMLQRFPNMEYRGIKVKHVF